MKLFFDCRFIKSDHHDGISRFSSELFSALASLTDVTAIVSDLRQLDQLPAGTKYIRANDPTDPIRELFLGFMLNRHGATHVFSPMQTMGSLGRRFKLILTLHDLIYYKHPKAPSSLPLFVRLAWRIYHLSHWPARWLLNSADAVVTVSQTSKGLIQKHRLTKRPVHVVYNAAASNPEHSALSMSRQGPSNKQLLYMGSFMDYKNVECLVVGMRELPEYELLLLSKISPERKDQLLKLAGDTRGRIQFKDGVSELQYAESLSRAFALVSASKDEGFGIPLVEAMNQALPLVVSDIPIFKEVAGDAAYFFNPADPNSFSEQVKLLSQGSNWADLSAKSFLRSRDFTWEASAKKLLQALREI